MNKVAILRGFNKRAKEIKKKENKEPSKLTEYGVPITSLGLGMVIKAHNTATGTD